MNLHRSFGLLLGTLGLITSIAQAHDPSAYGGLFRSRNYGGTWLNADVGLFLGAAVSMSIDPNVPEHLLLGTDTGLLESNNGGRQWAAVAADKLFGAVFAVHFSPKGERTLLSTPAAVYFIERGGSPQPAEAPNEAAPARDIVFGAAPDRVYLLGRRDLFFSDDAGRRWKKIESDLADQPDITELRISTGSAETLFIVANGIVMASTDAGQRWLPRMNGIEGDRAEGLSIDPNVPGRLWIGSADRIYVSDDNAATWKTKGQPLPETGINVRAIVADPPATALVIATHKGLLRSATGGMQWVLLEDNLPVHLDSRPLMHDRSAPGTIYAGFALLPYSEIWRIAIEGGNLLSRIDPVSLAGGIASLALLLLGGTLLARRLLRNNDATSDLRKAKS